MTSETHILEHRYDEKLPEIEHVIMSLGRGGGKSLHAFRRGMRNGRRRYHPLDDGHCMFGPRSVFLVQNEPFPYSGKTRITHASLAAFFDAIGFNRYTRRYHDHK